MADQVEHPKRGSVPLFSGKQEDFSHWKFQMEQYAEGEKIIDFYDFPVAQLPCPNPAPAGANAADRAAAEAAIALWHNGNTKAYTTLVESCNKDPTVSNQLAQYARIRVQVPGGPAPAPAQPHLAWMHLNNTYGGLLTIQCQQAYDDINNLKMAPGELAASYWGRASQLRRQHIMAGGQMDRYTFLSCVNNGLLQPKYTYFIQSQQMALHLTEEAIYGQLLSHWGGIQDAQSRQGAQGAANYVSSKGQGGGPGGAKGGQDEDSKYTGDNWGKMGRPTNGGCHGCHKTGHGWRYCFDRPNRDPNDGEKGMVPLHFKDLPPGNQGGSYGRGRGRGYRGGRRGGRGRGGGGMKSSLASRRRN